MIRILLHLLILPAMLWLDRRNAARPVPMRSALMWYALGVPLMLIEARASGDASKPIFLQSLLVTLFFLPPAYLAFRYARRRGGVLKPFLLYLVLSCAAGLVSALVLAQTPGILGSIWKA